MSRPLRRRHRKGRTLLAQVRALAPWTLSALVLVSLTARAGQSLPAAGARPLAEHAVMPPAAPLLLASLSSDAAEPGVGAWFLPQPPAPPVFDGSTLRQGGTVPGASGSTGSLRDLTARRPEGTTPAPRSAVLLASATPATTTPEVLETMPFLPRQLAVGPSGAGRGYLDLIPAAAMEREQRCLAEAVYFEARSESEAGQAAVAQVVLNRVRSGLYPSTVCGVVYQNRHRFKACQFTFACEGRSLAITEPGPWRIAVRIAKDVSEGRVWSPGVGAATHYHATYVRPYWAPRLKRMDAIGRHVFYSLRPGQT